MKNVIDVLRDQYNATISQEDDWGFFSVLASYINYILETPTLRKITDEIMGKKQKEYDKLAKLEEKSLQELKQAENKLLKIVEKNNISHTSLTPDWSSIPNPPRMNTLETLKAFEEGHISISGFKSNNLEKFLFDIAASILKQGYQSELKDFLVLNEEYGLYYSKADGKISINSNTRGNFIFSNTLKLRREQSEFIEKTEKFELWGAFNALLKFQKAFLEKSQNKSLDYICQKYGEGVRNHQEGHDAVDIAFFAQDLGEITESKGGRLVDYRSRHHLKKDDFKNYASMVNAYLIKELAKPESKKEENNKENYNVSFDEEKSILTIQNKPIKIRKFSNQYYLLKAIFQDEENDWQFSELLEKIGEFEDYNWKKLYDVANAIKKNIAAETGIKDFFITTTQSIKINKRNP